MHTKTDQHAHKHIHVQHQLTKKLLESKLLDTYTSQWNSYAHIKSLSHTNIKLQV